MAGADPWVEAAHQSEDLEHQQLRVLLLVGAVGDVPGTGKKLNGLTKLAKLDFIARYDDFEPLIAARLCEPDEVRPVADRSLTSAPMVKYRYGPWDDRYYPVLGALVGRGLVKYARGPRGSVAMSVTSLGRAVIRELSADSAWAPIAARYSEVADRYGRQTGNALKQAIYEALPEAMAVPLGRELL